MMTTSGLFDEYLKLERLTMLGDVLMKLSAVVDFEIFRPLLTEIFEKEHKGAGGRPPYDYVLMFKIVILQRIYNLSDDQIEFQINDRLTFMRFLGLNCSDKVPDAKTVWNFKNILAQNNSGKKLFDLFSKELNNSKLILNEGRIIDATFVEVPKQHNSPDDNKTIKEGEIPQEWKSEDPKNKHKVRQKDTDARWARKGNERHFGYKNHVKSDAKSKLITDYKVTAASVHESTELKELVNKNDKTVWADSGYVGKTGDLEKEVLEKVKFEICERRRRGHPLTPEQKESNRQKSKIRSRIEHIFGFMTNSMHGISIRSIGLIRAEFNIAIMNLTYNMFRMEILLRNQS